MTIVLALLFSASVYASPSQLSVHIGQDTKRSEGGAYIIRSFVLDQTDYFLNSTTSQQVDAIYWYPSGKIKFYTQTGQGILFGQSKPISSLSKPKKLIYYFPSHIILKQRNEITRTGTSREGITYRSLRSKAIISLPKTEPIFIESTQTQILDGGTWTTP